MNHDCLTRETGAFLTKLHPAEVHSWVVPIIG